MTAQVSKEFSLPIACSVSGAPFGVSHPIAHDLLMVAREAVYNAVLHGAPASIEVLVAYDRRELSLSVIDDGCGFDLRQLETGNGHHFGVKGMRERIQRSGGKLRLISTVGEGTRVEVRLPRKP